MRRSQTVCKYQGSPWADVWRNGNNTVWTLGCCNAAGEDGIRDWELEELEAALTCGATWNGVEGVRHT